MSDYQAPLDEMNFVVNRLLDLTNFARAIDNEDASEDLLQAVLTEAGKLATQVWAPINASGDKEGVKLTDQGVKSASGFKQAYQEYSQGGWGGLYFDEQYGGQGLPFSFAMPVAEMTNAANMSLGLCPMLTAGAIEAIAEHGSETLKDTYLEKMVSGQWTGTMNLTEPHAGTDLAAITSTATPDGQHYRIKGQKIYITWGDHDMTDNIIHLVLAKLPDAPEGVKGISLFLVPKFLVNTDGSLGARNDAHAINTEHKLGIHASPTCVMSYGDNGGAVGYLVGQPHQGLSAMFTMMNNERLVVGLQGVSLSDRAYQGALKYARERIQCAPPGSKQRGEIIHHPDVRRMLMTMRSITEAGRAISYVTAAQIDLSHKAKDETVRGLALKRVGLLIPIVKGWCTEVSQEITSLGVQVHGGMGFIEETGAAQHQRDARILTIYEGTTGIQALDLVGRKTLYDQGAAMADLVQQMRDDLVLHGNAVSTQRQGYLSEAIDGLESSYKMLLKNAPNDVMFAGSVSFDLLMLSGYVCGAWQMLRSAGLVVLEENETFKSNKLATVAYYLDHILPRFEAHRRSIVSGCESVMAIDAENL
ncbi:acyl-CoA dehydrogenase family protein [Oceanospirillaceae bacterium]|jgi:alkylation response protein AidB-like acyl-CoA dehydrogenase|nr:acyl-CoA dehydrogenase family protein [Oceanospirillaceae bacterium]MDC1341603.1 acyl-CoA dehydrogenase family protein [Oceanospirillaceae bacterium]MDC1341619.1 acyl-CoA dehydrogenase family protein [Oceanospirillaceae bacterium]|tara:strand:+ start:7221 stop:8984 length:1764 start_codon:yes stop_codon:yes gene_type:complete